MTEGENKNSLSLKSQIEKILVSGSISQEEQNNINKIATNAPLDSDGRMAIGLLTEMISKGRVNVI